MEGLSPQEMEEEMRLETWKAVSWALKGFDGSTLLPSDGPAPESVLALEPIPGQSVSNSIKVGFSYPLPH